MTDVVLNFQIKGLERAESIAARALEDLRQSQGISKDLRSQIETETKDALAAVRAVKDRAVEVSRSGRPVSFSPSDDSGSSGPGFGVRQIGQAARHAEHRVRLVAEIAQGLRGATEGDAVAGVQSLLGVAQHVARLVPEAGPLIGAVTVAIGLIVEDAKRKIDLEFKRQAAQAENDFDARIARLQSNAGRRTSEDLAYGIRVVAGEAAKDDARLRAAGRSPYGGE